MSNSPVMLVVPDGMADWDQPDFDDRTPVEVADTPNLDALSREGRLYRVRNIPGGCAADSAIANLALLGYDPREHHLGRGPLEAINLGIDLEPGEVAFRCNLVTVNDHDVLVDYSADNLSTSVNKKLFARLNERFESEGFRFVPGLRYRGILIVEGMEDVRCELPHDEMGEKIHDIWPSGDGAERLKQMMAESRKVLEAHDYNKRRRQEGEPVANMAWPWGNGVVEPLPSIEDRYDRDGSVVAGVDLIQGLGLALGFEKIDLPGASGDYDTDMAAMAEAAVDEVASKDFVYLHIEAIDEAGHDGDAELKVDMIEKWDEEMLGPVRDAHALGDFDLVIAPDHYTPIQKRTHVDDPIPLLVNDGDGSTDRLFTEDESQESQFVESGWEALADYYAGNPNPFRNGG